MEGAVLFMLSVVAACSGYPLEEPVEVRMLTSENFTSIAELLNKGRKTIEEVDTKKILDLISMLKRTHKTPLAIILTENSKEDDNEAVNAIDREENDNDDIQTEHEGKADNRGLNFTTESDVAIKVNSNDPDDSSVEIKENVLENQDKLDIVSETKEDNEIDVYLGRNNKDSIEQLDPEKENIISTSTTFEPTAAITSDALEESASERNSHIEHDESPDVGNIFDIHDENENVDSDSDEIYPKLQENGTNSYENVLKTEVDGMELVKNTSNTDNDLDNIQMAMNDVSDRDDTIFDKEEKMSKELKVKSDGNLSDARVIGSKFKNSQENEKDFEKLNCTILKDNKYYYMLSEFVENTNAEHRKDRKRTDKTESLTYNLSFFFNK